MARIDFFKYEDGTLVPVYPECPCFVLDDECNNNGLCYHPKANWVWCSTHHLQSSFRTNDCPFDIHKELHDETKA